MDEIKSIGILVLQVIFVFIFVRILNKYHWKKPTFGPRELLHLSAAWARLFTRRASLVAVLSSDRRRRKLLVPRRGLQTPVSSTSIAGRSYSDKAVKRDGDVRSVERRLIRAIMPLVSRWLRRRCDEIYCQVATCRLSCAGVINSCRLLRLRLEAEANGWMTTILRRNIVSCARAMMTAWRRLWDIDRDQWVSVGGRLISDITPPPPSFPLPPAGALVSFCSLFTSLNALWRRTARSSASVSKKQA